MQVVTMVWTVFAVVPIILAVVCGLLWLMERQDYASLATCVLGLVAAASAFAELGMMRSTTVAEYLSWLRWYYLPTGLSLMCTVVFVHYYLGTGRPWLLWLIIVTRSLIIGANFAVYPAFAFSRLIGLDHVSLWGEQISAIVAVSSPRQWFATLTTILWLIYVVDAVVQAWRKQTKDSRRKAMAVTVGLIVPLVTTNVYIQLIAFGIVHNAVSSVSWMLGAMLMMAYELGREFISNRRVRLEVAELRSQLAQADRINVMGQLASALAHELAQPLSATSYNVEAALAQLKREKPDLNEVRAILADIGQDDRRAGDIIHRMRDLFKRRTIKMRPVRLEDVVDDVLLLIRAEATDKRVALRLDVAGLLPLVMADPVHLTQVFLNLLMNSIQALQSRPSDSRYIAVEAKAIEGFGEIEVMIRDSGPGIANSIVSEVFKPFFTTKVEGTGTGLSLARAIIEAHGGRLWYDPPEEGRGAVFRFTLRSASIPMQKPIYEGAAREAAA
jgi:signal transduction histidine kinase